MQIAPRLVEGYLMGTVEMETGGTETLIPAKGRLIVAFAPHSGWIESMAIDACFDRAGRPWPVWLTKADNRSLPGVLAGRRLICMDRQTPEPRTVRRIYGLLQQPGAALATSLEGAILSNPHDEDDLRTLGPFKSGIARFAIRALVPILPVLVLGAQTVAGRLEDVWKEQGTLQAYRAIHHLRKHRTPLTVRWLPLYRDHLTENRELHGRRLGARAKAHTDQIREQIVAALLEIDPHYPIYDGTEDMR
jgi:1-acyl-sn-glycerol-3-phosphate acyltransferase